MYKGDAKQYTDKELLYHLEVFFMGRIFSGSGNRDLAESICQYLGVPLQNATVPLMLSFNRLGGSFQR